MIWSNRNKLCFVHIPKTGGTSITAAYEPQMLFDDIILGGTALGEMLQKHYRTRFGLHKHSGARSIMQAAGTEAFAAAFSFSLIRDPVGRVVSLYRWLRDGPPGRHPLSGPAAGLDFDAFAPLACESFPSQAAHVKAAGRVAVSRLYRFDDLPQAWADVARRIGGNSALSHRNMSRSQDVRVSAAARNTIETFYAEDLALYRAIAAVGN
ncbi:sulfotransferase family 2 domain-containing protein [Roseomonas terrae]|jgi:hypothetical protein|uniref:Sulfotransferase family 2 domain-containing protein n=1 Tax=Neoroseomonas terrae TaxID=424799 RepID=A0ABS5EJB1_9PROT|nr:sulfotransferase family 2 domain-containing protein [Neoroseomonas terrae]MBR0651098.1 sulfotransferase family 2 domain-containing protein [Neoroseomonas terrae]